MRAVQAVLWMHLLQLMQVTYIVTLSSEGLLLG
jgi:hypothetical protein